jgi:hypothetical protein
MPKIDLLKLIFHHDQRLEQLAPQQHQEEDPLAMFTKPDPTYSTLYFSGTALGEQKFGLNTLERYSKLILIIDQGLDSNSYQTSKGTYSTLSEALSVVEINDMILIATEEVPTPLIHSFSGKIVRDVLEKGWIVLFKRQAKDGFDLQIFSKNNIYLSFFYELQKNLESTFRFFSINGKRVHNEQLFYFETNRLKNPPHGFEEVFPESIF